MSDTNLILTLGKVIVAAAWADHEIAHEEINSLKDLLFHLPELTGRDWASLEMYIESPVGAAERELLVEQLKDALRSSADKELAIRALDDLVAADGVVTDEERLVVEQIKEEIQAVNVGVIGLMGKLIGGSLSRRQAALAEAPNREEHFEDYIKNKVYYGIKRRQELGEAELEIPEAKLRKLALAGGLMARVAHVDLVLTEDEFAAIVDALQSGWGIDRNEATFVAEVAVSEIGPDMDYYRLCRGFFDTTETEERTRFLKVLFAVADADGEVSSREIEEIRAIANSLRLTHKQFIDAKLTIDRDRRAS